MERDIVLFNEFNEFNDVNSFGDGISWSRKIGGEYITITMGDILDIIGSEPVIDIKVSDIRDKCIHIEKKDDDTLRRVENSNLVYPIIIVLRRGGDYGMIIDGHHRLLKAIRHNIRYIRARVLDLSRVPILYSIMFDGV